MGLTCNAIDYMLSRIEINEKRMPSSVPNLLNPGFLSTVVLDTETGSPPKFDSKIPTEF